MNVNCLQSAATFSIFTRITYSNDVLGHRIDLVAMMKTFLVGSHQKVEVLHILSQ